MGLALPAFAAEPAAPPGLGPREASVSDGRAIGANGRCETPVGSTVDVASATWTHTIGASELIAFWTDPDFDPSLPAFYYARVIEIPTPRWTAHDAAWYGTDPPEGAIMAGDRARLHLGHLVHALRPLPTRPAA